MTYISLDDDDSTADYKDLQAAWVHLLRCAHTDDLVGVPSALLPGVLHLADKYLFPRVAMLCTQAMEEQVAQDREMALKVCSDPCAPVA